MNREILNDIWNDTDNGSMLSFYTELGKFPIFYHANNDGGGTTFGQDYIKVLKNRYNRKFNYCYEWCSGPGFIGYSILENDLCDKLFLSDMWKPAIDDAEFTKHNLPANVKDKVTIHLIKDIDLLPGKYQFDLVVGNPPHFKHKYVEKSLNGTQNRLCSDIGWESHLNFFKYISKNLSKDGIILLQENINGSTLDDFENMITSNNLIITDVFPNTNLMYYYIEVKHSNYLKNS